MFISNTEKEKQEMLEDMYRYDYFAYRDIADLVHVSV